MEPSIEPAGGSEQTRYNKATGDLVAICVAYFMVILDTTVVNVALPTIGKSLRTTTTGLEWVVDAYSLAFGALLLLAGALSDRRGAKSVFQAGVALFAFASAACGLAPSISVLVAARVLQGVGAALAVPASLALLHASYPDQADRRRAFGVWGGVAGIAAAAGPVAGGALVAGLGWRWVFLVNLPIATAGLVLGSRYLPALPRRTGRFDLAGQILGAAALVALTAALVEVGNSGWGSTMVAGGLGAFAVFGAGFVAVERTGREPMLPPSLFSSHTFSAATSVGLQINFAFYGELFVASLYLQDVHHMSPLLAGVALLPQMTMAVVGSAASGRLMARRDPRSAMLTGLVVGATGFAGVGLLGGAHAPYWPLVVPMAAAGLGMALTMPAATAAVMEAAPAGHGGLASGTLNAARQVGGVVGVALLGTLVVEHAGHVNRAGHMDHAGSVGGFGLAMGIASGAFVLGAVLAGFAVGRSN